MNKASEIVSEELLGGNGGIISISAIGKVYTLFPPTIKDICAASCAFSKIHIEEKENKLSIIGLIPDIAPYIIDGIASLLCRGHFPRFRRRLVKRDLYRATPEELRTAMECALAMMGSDDFFVCATLARQIARVAAKAK